MRWRTYDEGRDADAVVRAWQEVSWIDDSDRQKDAVRALFTGGRAWVAPGDGDAECAVHATPGSYRWLDDDLPHWAITAVTTSRVGRHQNYATELMAEALAVGVDEGAAVAGLGMFEQGFYDRFGFGTGPYEHEFQIDPATLDVPIPDRAPVRVTPEDHAEVTELLARRHRSHGGVVLDSPQHMQAEFGWHENPWGLGFRDTDGRLTHFVFGEAKGEHGPYTVSSMAYEELSQIIELLGVIKSLADQVRVVTFRIEPPEIQLQDFVSRPARLETLYDMAGKEFGFNAGFAWRQTRILDLQRCLSLVSWAGPPVRFGLHLTDPLAKHGGRWAGLGGEYTVTIAEETKVSDGIAAVGGPALEATVNGLSRLWSGAASVASLALLGDLRGPDDLLADLDRVFRLPLPYPGIDF